MVESSVLENLGQYFIERELGLHSDKFYQNLDHNYKNIEKYYADCSKFNDSGSKYRIRTICAKVLKYLESSAKIIDKKNSAYDDCLLLNYWIYGKLVQRYYNDSNTAIHAFGALQSVWNDLIENSSKTSYYDKCKPYFDIVIKHDWRKRKGLYDYCVDYDMLQKMLSFYPTRCNEIYIYLKEKDELYKEYSEHCSKTDNNMCPEFFSKCNNKDPNNLLRQLTCYGEMQTKEALSLKLKQRPASPESDPDVTAVKAELPTDSQTASEGTNPVTKSGNVLLGVVVTSMTSGALYKVKTDLIITH
ncbi:hypothetical protein PVIIG_05295 [Plasmodium vivax India VII]|uniref:Uncharacterized protein n=1 Tax=Plasmodium vivax India VII TaxID=1077284 RepID=A0A0J9S3I4_PLAVI|nr:hypothetical protein PVIIG_05295 [Plasmodium vivax India VII]